MVGKHIVLTLVVAAAAAYVGWEKAPAAWRPLNIFGLCAAGAAFVLWSVARFQLGK